MDPSLQAQIETYLSHLNVLIQRGAALRETLENNSSDQQAIAATRAWHEDCGVTINQLSGGSKAHWLARAFSESFLLRAAGGHAAEGAPPDEIVGRLIAVLEQAVHTLGQMDGGALDSASTRAPAPHRFNFVHNLELRPVLEQAYTDSRMAQEQGQYDVALRTSCGILEAIVTDALEHKGLNTLGATDAPPGKIGDWPFDTRLAVAEAAGLIRSGCARLPAAARMYRDSTSAGSEAHPAENISERDARITGQVLHVIMRDLDPGR